MSDDVLTVANAVAVPLRDVPERDFAAFRDGIITQVREGRRLLCLCAEADRSAWAVLADDGERTLHLARSRFDDRYESLTPDCPQAHLFEREIAEQYAIEPIGHPWLKPVRSHRPWCDAPAVFPDDGAGPAVIDFYRVEGDEVHEVAVGPVHAGVIEPGHFRFQCHGETVMHLEIALGYQHRGIERTLVGGPHPLTRKHMETLAGDTTIGHGTAWCQAMEALAGIEVPRRAHLIRAMALELERLANHTGDLGAIAGDVGFLPTMSYCGRIRGDWLNLSALLCGSRLGRDLLKPGGVRFDLDAARTATMRTRIDEVWTDTQDAIELIWSTASVLSRLEGTGVVDRQQAVDIGLTGVAMRACGRARDVRQDLPTGAWREFPCTARTSDGDSSTGDVHARARVRWLEMADSVAFLRWACDQLDAAPGPIAIPAGTLRPDHCCVSLTEGWRGGIVHFAVTGADSRYRRYKVVDPSFHNWFGLALALRGEQISDFPLCNKSFNLSYCGFDL